MFCLCNSPFSLLISLSLFFLFFFPFIIASGLVFVFVSLALLNPVFIRFGLGFLLCFCPLFFSCCSFLCLFRLHVCWFFPFPFSLVLIRPTHLPFFLFDVKDFLPPPLILLIRWFSFISLTRVLWTFVFEPLAFLFDPPFTGQLHCLH